MDEPDIFFFGSKKSDKKKQLTNEQTEPPQSNNTSQPKVIISRPTTEVDYKTNNPHVGLAIVLNHKYLRGQTIRNGTEKDSRDITASLENYGFEVRVYNDLTRKQIETFLKSVATEDHGQFDCFALVVMTHGDKGRICASDEFYSTEKLWEPLLGNNCLSLLGKPKLFFIQACRGKRLDQPVIMRVNVRSVFTEEANKSVDMTYAIPSTADMLVMYSTFEDHFSFRNSKTGSWFIQSLCSVLNESATDERIQTEGAELLRLLTAVNRKVAYEYQSYHTNDLYDQKKEMPNFMSTLTKTFFLKKKPKRFDAKIDAMPEGELENGQDDDDKNVNRIGYIFTKDSKDYFIKGPVQFI